MNFPDALKECLNGKRIRNVNWNGKGMYVEVVLGGTNEYYDVLLPYLQMSNVAGEKVPWLISQMDVFSEGWEVVE
jgi:hypothetical protein